MTIRSGLAVLALMAATPAFAASAVATSQVAASLQQQGFPANRAAAVARVATDHYRGAALVRLATALHHLPSLPRGDYAGATLKAGAADAYALVLTKAMIRTVPPVEVMAAGHAFSKAVDTGTDPQVTARLVIQGLAHGLHGRALARLADHYAQRIHKGVAEKAAYRESLAASLRSRPSPVGGPTALDPTSGAMGAHVNGMGGATGGGMAGAMTMGAGAPGGPGAAMSGAVSAGGGTPMGGGAAMGGGAMGRP